MTLPTILLCLALLHLISSPLLVLTLGAPFVWIGAVNSTSLTVHADIPKGALQVVLSDLSNLSRALEQRDPDAGEAVAGDTRIYGRLRRFTFTGLKPSTRYHIGYTLRTSGPVRLASTLTFPAEGQPSDVVLAFSSCQLSTSWDDSFKDIVKRRSMYNKSIPFLFLHMGDLAYSDIGDNDASKFEGATRAVVTSPAVHSLFNSTPVVYMYDDHDFGPNNADGSSMSKEAALRNYYTVVPRYNSFSDVSYHAFTIGRIRVIVTDLRSHSDRVSGNTTLGATQLQWLLNEFGQWRNYSLMVWLSTKPWIGTAKPGSDSWPGFSSERATISTYLLNENVTNLIMTSGDAHMLAVDDGTHSAYHEATSTSSSMVGGFPVFQAAPLGHFGNAKGGPYSHGCAGFRFYRNYQYALLAIKDSGDKDEDACIQFSGFRANRKKPILSFKRCGVMRAPQRDMSESGKTCTLVWVPAWVWVVFSLALLWLTATCVGIVVCTRAIRHRRKTAKVDQESFESPTESTTLS